MLLLLLLLLLLSGLVESDAYYVIDCPDYFAKKNSGRTNHVVFQAR